MNIAEILRNEPTGTKLYSPFLGEVEFFKIADEPNTGKIVVRYDYEGEKFYYFNPDGTFSGGSECMLFPAKDRRDWSKYFKRPQNGDIMYVMPKNSDDTYWIFVYNYNTEDLTTHICSLCSSDGFLSLGGRVCDNSQIEILRNATFEEAILLNEAIEKAGYILEGTTLTKRVMPKFNIGDLIEDDNHFQSRIICIDDEDRAYIMGDAKNTKVPFKEQDAYRLARFNINDFKLFDRVLVRAIGAPWSANIYSHYIFTDGHSSLRFVCGNSLYVQCIPYNDFTKHLLGQNIDAPEFYKTW